MYGGICSGGGVRKNGWRTTCQWYSKLFHFKGRQTQLPLNCPFHYWWTPQAVVGLPTWLTAESPHERERRVEQQRRWWSNFTSNGWRDTSKVSPYQCTAHNTSNSRQHEISNRFFSADCQDLFDSHMEGEKNICAIWKKEAIRCKPMHFNE